jgi:predicted ATP-dependent endonuclease of OLD family
MELLYAWIEKFRNYKEVGLNFSEKFYIKYNVKENNVEINSNNSYISVYPKHISNINAVVGRNGIGKTNLLDAIGLRTNDRNKNNAEFEVKYRSKRKFGYRIPDDIEAEIKHSIYFFIYYMGKDRNNQDLFCIEGNDIESFQNLIKNQSGISLDYWKSKYWFALVCNYVDGNFSYKFDLNEKIEDFGTGLFRDKNRSIDDNRREMDKLAIISLRENLDEKYYDFSSTKAEDDYKISVPRRTGTFQSKLLSRKIEMLFDQMAKPNRLMFKDTKYILKINFKDYFLVNGFNDDEKLKLKYSYKELNEKEKEICKVLESFIQYFFNAVGDISKNKEKTRVKKQVTKLSINRMSFKELKNYYFEILQLIVDIFFGEDEFNQYLINSYKRLAVELSKNKSIQFDKGSLILELTKKTNTKECLKIINITVDEKKLSIINDNYYSAFSGFFSYSIENLSDGEAAYLGFFASLNEQISTLTSHKESYIILLDEPEARMHPELTRNFINELIRFLGDLSEGTKNFQIIISTHSPFILSDIPSTNIIYLEKNNNGNCKSVKRDLSTFGTNIHTLFKDGFFMSSTMGEFATNKIKEVISKIDTYSIGDMNTAQKKEILYIINSIGEPLIRNRLMKMFIDKFDLDYTDLYYENQKLKGKLKQFEEPTGINETIDILRKQVDSLQTQVNNLEGRAK